MTQVEGMDTVRLTIDGQQVTAQEGATVLEAALENDIYIPHLCHHPDLAPGGVCRLCMVDIEGRGETIGCRAPVADGMVVRTSGPGVDQTRRVALELLLINHKGECNTCYANTDCELQRACSFVGVDPERLARLRHPELDRPVDSSNPFFEFDPNKCVLCGLCVRTCDEIQGLGALDFAFRGFATTVATFGDQPFAESICESCGECVTRCPVGALAPKRAERPAHEVDTVCAYCGVGCGIHLGVRGDRVVSVRGNRDNPANHGRLCVKGRFGHSFVNHAGRLRKPLIRTNGELVEAEWDDALDLVAGRLAELKAKHGGDALAVLSSAKCSNEDNYVMQKFARAVLGTNNVDHCARLCHASTVAGLAQAFGSGAMTNSIGDIAEADTIFVIGSNTTESHPVIGLEVRRAVRRGETKLLLADPRNIPLSPIASLHLRQECGTDVALLNGMMHVILREGLQDDDFIGTRTEGFDELRASLEAYTPDYVEAVTGVPQDDVVRAARMYGGADKATILYAMGITQHTTGTDNVRAVANLAMLTGNLGRPGTGVNPLRGQNNVQGACDMGALPNVLPGYQSVADGNLRAKFRRAWGVDVPAEPGLTVVEMTNAATDGRLHGLYVMGENPMLTDPDTNHVRKALGKLDFVVVQDIFLTETAAMADVVLPAASFAEKDGTVTNTERRVQRLRRAILPVGESREDWRIISDVARRMGYPMAYDSAADVMEEIAGVTPIYGGVGYERLDGEGLQWPCPDRDHGGTPVLHGQSFTRGLGAFGAVDFEPPDELVDEEYPLVLSTGRVLYHYHTVLTRKVDGLNELSPGGTIEVNAVDAAALGISHGDLVQVASRRGELVAKAEVANTPPVGTVFMAFHFAEAAANLLTTRAYDPVAKIPELKACAVRVAKLSGAGEAAGEDAQAQPAAAAGGG